jgi:predicted O-methyltransferase YrrM
VAAAMSVLDDPDLEKLLAQLHAQSDDQRPAMEAYYAERRDRLKRPSDEDAARNKTFLSDKLVALDRDKAEFCYLLCRSLNAKRIIEIGTSNGVSTLYLAAAVRDKGGGVVIGTEHEPEKAKIARANFAQAELGPFIELREGDLRETLRDIEAPIDFMLVDIWIPMAAPALELVARHLRSGAIVICDNTEQHRAAYADYFRFLADPANGFRTMTLPFSGGLELSVRL